MLKTSKVYERIDALNDVNSDFVQRIQLRRDYDQLLQNIDEELFRWSLESRSHFTYSVEIYCAIFLLLGQVLKVDL